MRALASHQCVSCSNQRHMCVEFVVGSHSCPDGFSPGSPVFLHSQKPTLKFQFDLETVNEETLCGYATVNSYSFRSFVRSFVVHSFVRSYHRSFVRSFVYLISPN